MEPEQKTKKQIRDEKQKEKERLQQAKREADEKAKQDIYKYGVLLSVMHHLTHKN